MNTNPIHVIASAPGRINIIGEHTDYNDGFVLPAAIDLCTTAQFFKNGSSHMAKFVAEDVDEELEFNLDNFSPHKNGGWKNYVLGVVNELQKLGGKIEGFSCSFSGTVPIGSGLSSSAALECSIAKGLDTLFGLGFDNKTLIMACVRAEHNFVGIKCGVMDQYASMMGKKDQVILLDCRSLEHEYHPFDLGEYQVVILNTNVSHALASSEYNKRRAECEAGVSVIRQKYGAVIKLRDVRREMLYEFKDEMDEVVFKRCQHVVNENERVTQATAAMLKGQFDLLGRLMFASHESLSELYGVSCAELDFLVDRSKANPDAIGSRMMGGGFGGCTISLVRKGGVQSYIKELYTAYESHFGIQLTSYGVQIEDGCKAVIKE
jgi:galactokinase